MLLKDDHLTFQNPKASIDLRIAVALQPECDKDYVKYQLRKNIQAKREWVSEREANQQQAIICGASPSLVRNIEQIKEKQSAGGIVYACNRAAKVLVQNGIIPDYQVILDPHEAMLDVFCKEAKGHLFSALVNPQLLAKATDAMLWFPMMEWVGLEMAKVKRQFAYIGGGITVTNFVLCLAYTLGHRDLSVFGVDSSYEDSFYADGQMAAHNSGQLLVDVEFDGKIYKTSYDMQRQTEAFMLLADALKSKGVKIAVTGSGLLPDMFNHKGE